jgi:SSS family transporter
VLFLAARTVASSLRLFLAATVLETITGLALPVSIGVIGVSTILYTYVGGLRGVVWADVLQFFVYIAGGIAAVFVIGQLLPGGWHEVFTIARAEDKLRVFDFSPVLNRPYTFWAGVIGAMVLDMGTHGADLMMVQRYLSARSQREASGALVSSGCVILVQFALFLAIGLGVYALDQTTQSPERLPPAKDAEFATFIVERLPVGLKGLVIAAVFSVTMSTVSGALSSSASSTMNDLVKPWFPHASEARLVRSSRFVTAGWGLAQMAGALGAAGMNQAVIDAALAVAGFVSGILLGVFLLGIFDPRANQRGAFAGMVAGILAVSVAAFGTRLAYPWYALVGATTVLLVGMCGSRLITKREGA